MEESSLLFSPSSGWLSFLVVLLLILGWRFLRHPGFVFPRSSIVQRRRYAYVSLLACMVVCILLLPWNIRVATPQKTSLSVPQQLYILLDVSLSMSATDISPSRFQRAKDIIEQVVTQQKNIRVGIIAFSGIPVLHIPLTSDIDAFTSRMQETTLADFPPTTDFVGTALGDAMIMGLTQLEHLEQPGKLLLITDGDVSEGIDPLQVAAQAAYRNITISTLGIGSDMTVLGTDTAGKQVIASLNSDMLEHIADVGKGTHYRLQDQQSSAQIVAAILSDWEHVETSDIAVPLYWSLNDFLIVILIGCCICLIVRRGVVFVQIYKVLSNNTSGDKSEDRG